jgi:hypothetical protein
VADDDMCGTPVPAGSMVAVLPYLIHRNPAVWPNPAGFDPSRFLSPAPERHRYAWIPFGGRRRCWSSPGCAATTGSTSKGPDCRAPAGSSPSAPPDRSACASPAAADAAGRDQPVKAASPGVRPVSRVPAVHAGEPDGDLGDTALVSTRLDAIMDSQCL